MPDIALLGGGMNPVGRHHEFIAWLIHFKLSMRTWLMPCFNHKFDKNSLLLPAFHRWAMLVLSCKNSQVNSRPCSWEIEHEHSGAMYDTMTALKKLYPKNRFHIVVGMDNANLIEKKWYKGKELIGENPFIVIHRPGFKAEADWFQHEPHKILIYDDPSSSSDIREAVRKEDRGFLAQRLDPDVLAYIDRHRLYY